MANSNTGINDLILPNAITEAFTAEVAPLSLFTADFSPDAAKKGDTIHILRTIAATAATTKATHAAYTIQDANNDYISLTLGQPAYVSWGLDDVEISLSSLLSMEVFAKQ